MILVSVTISDLYLSVTFFLRQGFCITFEPPTLLIKKGCTGFLPKYILHSLGLLIQTHP